MHLFSAEGSFRKIAEPLSKAGAKARTLRDGSGTTSAVEKRVCPRDLRLRTADTEARLSAWPSTLWGDLQGKSLIPCGVHEDGMPSC